MPIDQKSLADRIRAVEEAETDNFIELARIAGLDPATSFRYRNLSKTNFSNCNLFGFYFTGSKLDGSSFSNAKLAGAIFDAEQCDALKDQGHYQGNASSREDADFNEFIIACANGNLAEVQRLLDAGVHVDACRPPQGRTGLMAASHGGHASTVELLLDQGASANFISPFTDHDDYGSTALMAASSAGHLEIVNLLLEAGANPNLISKGITPILLACKHTKKEVIKLFLSLNDIHLNISPDDGVNPLIYSCKVGNVISANTLLSSKILNVNIFNSDGMGALHVACENNRIEVLSLLLEHPNVDVNLKFGEQYDTPLHTACTRLRTKIVRTLIHVRSIDVNSIGALGKSPLQVAITQTHRAKEKNNTSKYEEGINCIKLLTSYPKIDINMKTRYKHNTALSLAEETRSKFILNILLKSKNILL